jgi:hypothetical protein
MNYHVVFDEVAQGYRESWFPLLLLGAGIWLLGLRAVIRRGDPEGAAKLFPAWIVPFAILLGGGGSLAIFLQTYPPHAALRDALRAGTYQSVEGRVSWVQSGDPGGFGVVTRGGQEYAFHYSDHQWTPGYRALQPPIAVGSPVRVAEVDGHIARLEVADAPRP